MTRPTLLVMTLVMCLAASALAEESADDLTPEEAFRRLPAYTYDQPRRLLRFLEAHIQRATGDPKDRAQVAERLSGVLSNADATLDAKRFVCRWLPLVGGEEQVPVLARMLQEKETTEIARQALRAMPGEASAKVLRDALQRAKGDRVIGLINALGGRRDAQALDAIVEHLVSDNAAVAAAAADALGAIGSAEAAEALAAAAKKAEGHLADVIRDARLRCARHLATAGDREAAGTIYTDLLAGDLPVRWRIAAMVGMVDGRCPGAAAVVDQALESGDARMRASAIQASRRIGDPSMTERLVKRLPRLAPVDQVFLLDALADRGDAAARPGVMKMVEAADEIVRAAAVRALGRLGTAEDVPRLLTLAAEGKGEVKDAAQAALARLDTEGVDKRVLSAAAQEDGPRRIAAIRALADRQTAGAGDVLLTAAAKADTAVRVVALETLAEVGSPADYGRLVDLLAKVEDGRVASAAERAAVAVGKRVGEGKPRLAPVRRAMDGASPAGKARLLGLLPALGDVRGLDVLEPYLDADDAALRDAAVRALVQWPDSTAGNLVLEVARESDNRTHRVLAFRGYLRMMKQNPDAAARHRMMTLIRPLATTADAKKMFLAGLADMAEPWALAVAESFLDDPDVKAEAQAAVKSLRKVQQPKRQSRPAAVPKADPKRIAARKQELAKKAPKGFHLACYMDCGPQVSAAGDGKPRLRLLAGKAHVWGGSDRAAEVWFGTVAFDGREVVFEATGLDPERTYRLGFSWWDYDHDTRAQSVWASPGGGGPGVRVLEKTKLPSGARGQKPAVVTVPLPRDLMAAESVRLLFRNEATPNAVVSEVWLLESDGASEPPKATVTPQPQAKESAGPQPRTAAVDRSPKDAPTRVLLITGIDHPGHKWRQTAPVLREAIEQDPRLAVDVVEDPAWLETGDLKPYKAIVHHWMDWKTAAPGQEARENFARFVREGGGLVLVHFACGAWQDWPEFVKIAGRVWDPKLRGHDPRGPFAVHIVDADHPITRGMPASFETFDELYTCLAGETPIHVLAQATSKVDHKDYPMAFVLTYGKGRVFHCVLGHDVKALETPEARVLYRRGTAWAAGLESK